MSTSPNFSSTNPTKHLVNQSEHQLIDSLKKRHPLSGIRLHHSLKSHVNELKLQLDDPVKRQEANKKNKSSGIVH
jgi:hypothetical protein